MSETKPPTPETKPPKAETPAPPKKTFWGRLGSAVGNALGNLITPSR